MTIATPLGFGIAASLATLAGGVLALRLADRVVMILGLTAGVVLGVALFDLVPEALALAARTGPAPTGATPAGALPTLGWAAAGLGGYMLFERMLGRAERGGRWRGHLAPATLTLHSCLDGLGIGVAFQVSPEIGGVVALAVLTHDVADGVNVVSLCLAAEHHRGARAWLAANGLAPLLGVLIGLVLRVPASLMAPLMAVVAGVFLYIGACELLPRSHALDPRPRTTIASLAGIALIYVVATFAR